MVDAAGPRAFGCPAEVESTRQVGGYTVRVCSDEKNGGGWDL